LKLNIKLDRKIVGLSNKPVVYDSNKKTFDAEEYMKQKSQSGKPRTDKELVKVLKDRLNVLELELQKAREDSFQAGFEEGKERGHSDAAQELEEMKKQVNVLADEYKESILKLEIPILKLARGIAEKIIMSELKNGLEAEKIAIENIRKGLEEVIDEGQAVIRMAPEHLKSFAGKDIKKELNIQGKLDVNMIGDKSLKKGETVVESENYVIDGTYSAQLDHMQDQMIKEATE